MDKKNNLNDRLNNLKDNIKKIDKYISENNDKKVDTEKKIYAANNEYNELLLEYNQLKNIIKKTMIKLDKLKDEKIIVDKDKIIKINQKLDCQNAKINDYNNRLEKKEIKIKKLNELNDEYEIKTRNLNKSDNHHR